MVNKNAQTIKKAIVIILVLIVSGFTACKRKKPVKEKEEPIKKEVPKEVQIYIDKIETSPDVFIRQKAARRLGKMGEKAEAAIPHLIKMLGDKTLMISYEKKDDVKTMTSKFPAEYAVEALAKIGKPAVQPLIEAIGNDDINIRVYSMQTLGIIKDTRAVEPLIKALDDDDVFIQRNAMKTLREITGEDYEEDRAKWIEWWKKNKGKFSGK